MAVTAQQIFNITMALIDEVQDDGSISVTDTANYSAKTPSILTLGQAELLNQGEYFSTYEISNSPVQSLLGEQFSVVEFDGTDKIYEGVGARAYHFEVDNDCIVAVEENTGSSWVTLTTITHTQTGTGFSSYKGILSPSSTTNSVRIRFSGTFFYRFKNFALFKQPFADATKVPQYRPWIKVSMPSDFKSVSQIIEETGSDYIKSGDYKWEGKSDLYISYDFEGEMRIIYRPIPTAISSMSQEMQIDDITAITVLPYHLATHLMIDENPDIASYFNQKYAELKALAMLKSPQGDMQINNYYGDFNTN